MGGAGIAVMPLPYCRNIPVIQLEFKSFNFTMVTIGRLPASPETMGSAGVARATFQVTLCATGFASVFKRHSCEKGLLAFTLAEP